ncbi:MAG: hypothetical protein BWX86_01680 [Verrucomicrobia bacterium ADurb.Bin122]|nr:MAG: hypothetical protein BWX86_01680 [Verrucomicrobia bacterium ADurb.Bin122]
MIANRVVALLIVHLPPPDHKKGRTLGPAFLA